MDGVRRGRHCSSCPCAVDSRNLRRIWPELGSFAPEVVEQLEIDAQYAGYLDRQDADIMAFRRDEGRALPAGLDYGAVIGLSNEVRQKLERIRPATLGPGRPHRRRHGGRPHPRPGPCEGRARKAQKCLSLRLRSRGIAAAKAGVSRETLARLKAYADLLTDWNCPA